jgi:hypothetical protein
VGVFVAFFNVFFLAFFFLPPCALVVATFGWAAGMR